MELRAAAAYLYWCAYQRSCPAEWKERLLRVAATRRDKGCVRSDMGRKTWSCSDGFIDAVVRLLAGDDVTSRREWLVRLEQAGLTDAGSFLLDKGFREYKAHNYLRAAQILELFTEMAPYAAHLVRDCLAQCWDRVGNYQAALRQLRKAPDSEWPYFRFWREELERTIKASSQPTTAPGPQPVK